MSYIMARVCEATTWARFGQSIFMMSLVPGIPPWERCDLIVLAIALMFVAAMMPDPK